MKNKKTKIGLLFASSLAFFAVTAAALVGASTTSFIKEVKGYTGISGSNLTTTIDLNDTSAADIRSYYSSLNDKSAAQRQGTNLLANLKTILKNGQQYFSYDASSNALWRMYEITDRDWDLSPASAISGYNSSTNKITGYTYGTSASSSGTNPYIHALYVNRNVTNKMHAWALEGTTTTNHGKNGEWCIDREHIWPKSHGFNSDDGNSSCGVRGDPMHLWPGDSGVNSALHSNYYYGYVDTSKSYTDGYSWTYTQNGNYMGTSLTLGGSDNIFEPQDCDKGDIARAVFYLVARYNNYGGDDSDGFDSMNANLQLVQQTSDSNSSSYDSSSSQKGSMGIMTDLLRWNEIDPPDEWEIHRNNLLYNNYTKNRNPFIDFPEWANYIWGSVTYNGRNYSSHSTTPTGSANPSTDTINGFGTKTLSSISVTTMPTKTSYYKNDTLDTSGIVVTGTYDDSSTSNVTSECTFSPTTLSTAGTQQITVTHSSGLTTHFNVTVSNTTRTLSSIAVTTLPTKTTYTQGDTLDTSGIVVTGTYSDSSTGDVTSGCTFSPTTLSTVGTQQITVTHTETNKQTTFDVTVNEPSSTETLTITRSSFVSAGGYGTIDEWTATTSETSTSISGYADIYTKSDYMQFNGGNTSSLATGLFNKTAITGRITNITVNFNSSSTSGRTMDVYVGTSALFTYSSSTLTNNTSSGTKVGTASTSSTSFDVTGSNTYFALDKSSGALYIDSIVVTIATGSSSSDTVSLNKSSTSLTVGGTETLVATASGSVTWSSNNESVATVSASGTITAVAAGTATITATCGTASATCVVTVSGSTPTPTPSSDLAWTTNTAVYRKALFGSSYNSTSTSSYENSWSATNSDNNDSENFTVNLTNCYNNRNGWDYIKIGHKTNTSANTAAIITDSYIGKPIGRISINIAAMAVPDAVTSIKLYYDDNNTFSSPTELSFTKATGVQSVDITSPEMNQYYKIEVICTTQSTSNGVIQFNEIDFYDATQAESYAQQFLAAFTCDASGKTEPTFASGFSWTVLKTNFNSLNSYDKATLTGATANESGTTVEQAVARYDKVVSHWKYENFMSRSITGLNNRTSFISSDNELFIVIIATSSIVSITAVGLYMLLKKRKEQ